MRHLTVDGTTYDTVGEASVTQVQTSGTKIATVTIDGTATDLYAPEGGSGPEPSSTTPAMDGTAAVGTATTYARADHVHPTDTSRVAASVTNANGLTGTITNTGSVKLESVTAAGKTSTVLASGIGSRLTCTDEDSENYAIVEARTTYAMMEAEGASGTSSVTVEPNGVSIDKLVTPTTSTMPTTKQYVDDGLAAKQATLVSGTNIKTINGDSILGSGDLTISGGGGGMLVTFTTPDNGATYTADKTFGEIFAAFDSGIQPVFKFVSSSAVTTYTTIKDATTSGSSTPYGILFPSFYTTRLWGTASDYPSWSSDN